MWEGCPYPVIDNMSAVAWTDTRNTKYPEAQCALRTMSLMEATSHEFTSAEHIPGEKYAWADAGRDHGTPKILCYDLKI
jgi:hypothetical protein